MGNESRFKIPENCRGLGDARETIYDEKLKVAKKFIEKFVERVATPKNVDESDGAWTQSVRRRFFEICPEDCYPLPDAPWNAKGEFLADITWAEIGKDKRLLLACEIEWGTGWHANTNWFQVAEHFEKLLPVKASFKVFILSSDEPLDKAKRIVERDFLIEFAREKLAASLERYGHHLAGEVYIFIDFPRTHKPRTSGIYRSFIWLAKEFGKQEVKLMKGPGGDLIRS
jgi:hypothetical protein